MAGKWGSAERLRTVTKRQAVPAWGAKYQPAIKATRGEAPRCSRPTILFPRLLGREMHLLSDAETAYALLSLHHTGTFDIHEQHVISTLPALHPLATHPDAIGLDLPDLPGSIAVAESLGMLHRHPKMFLKDLGENGAWAPLPYVGDLLLFLRDAGGPYCINWTIKADSSQFKARRAPEGMRFHKVRTEDDDMRHQLEACHFSAAEIRTVQLSLTDISPDLVRNLRVTHGWDARSYSIPDLARDVVVQEMREIVGTSIVAIDKTPAATQTPPVVAT